MAERLTLTIKSTQWNSLTQSALVIFFPHSVCRRLGCTCIHSLPVVRCTREEARAFGRVLNCVVLSDARLPPLSPSLSERARSSARISPRATVARAGVDPSDRGRGGWRCSVIPHRFRDFALFVSRQRTLGPRFGEWCSLREAAAADAG